MPDRQLAWRGTGRRVFALVVLVGAFAASASPAAAITRHVVPSGGATSGECDSGNPCEIQFAVETAADPGDEVVVPPGTYPLSDPLDVEDQINLHGQEGAARPLLTGALAGHLVSVSDTGTRVAGLDLDNNFGSAVTLLSNGHPTAGGTVIDQVRAEAHGGNGTAIEIGGGDTVTNSVAWVSHPSNTTAVEGNGSTGSGQMEVRNVTAVAHSINGEGVALFASGGADTMLMRNVIALAGGTDVLAFAAGTGNSATIDVNFSNYNECVEDDFEPDPSATCAEGINNQTASPEFVDLLGGDFHQLSTSPTIGAGFTTAANGPFDLDGDPRLLGAGTDIGADEFRIAPVATTAAATGVAQDAATLNGSANPRGLATTVHFEYGTDTSYGASTAAVSVGSGTADAPVATPIAGLAPNTTYHYRAVATNSGGTTQGADMTFTTQPAPEQPGPGGPSGPGGPGSGGLGGVTDLLAPGVQSFGVTNRRFRRGNPAPLRGTGSRRRAAPRGTHFRYALSEPARAVITIERKTTGRRVGRRCQRATRRNRTRRRCTLYVRAGALNQQGQAGANTLAFAGRIGRRNLAVGTYRARVVAADAAGNASRPRTTSFTIVRR